MKSSRIWTSARIAMSLSILPLAGCVGDVAVASPNVDGSASSDSSVGGDGAGLDGPNDSALGQDGVSQDDTGAPYDSGCGPTLLFLSCEAGTSNCEYYNSQDQSWAPYCRSTVDCTNIAGVQNECASNANCSGGKQCCYIASASGMGCATSVGKYAGTVCQNACVYEKVCSKESDCDKFTHCLPVTSNGKVPLTFGICL